MRGSWLPLTGLLGCSAPSLDDAPDRGPTPSPAELREEAEARDAVAPSPSPAELREPVAAAPPPSAPEPVAPSPPPGEETWDPPPLTPTPAAALPPAPFTAYTTAPMSVAGVAQDRVGIRVEVTAVRGEVAEITCSACAGAAAGASATMPVAELRAGRAPGGSGDALDTMLMLRARWAGAKDLPSGATNIALCSLVDHGFTLTADRAAWKHAGGSATLAWSGQVWDLTGDLVAPDDPAPWSCRAGGHPPSSPPPASDPP